MPQLRLLGAGAILLALAAAAVLWPRETATPPETPPLVSAASPQLRLDQRLADAGAVLVRSATGGQSRRLERPVAIIGGAPSEAAPHFVRLAIRHADGADSHCGGTLLVGGWIVTAAHCVDSSEPWAYVEVSVGPATRSAWGRARYRLGEAAVHRLYEGADSVYRHDVALLRLPDDPGGGLPWPQSAQTELEPGEVVTACGMGLGESGRLAEELHCASLPVAEVRPSIVRLDGLRGGFRQADSGGPVMREATGTPVGVISHYDGGRADRQFIMPFPALWAAGVRGAW